MPNIYFVSVRGSGVICKAHDFAVCTTPIQTWASDIYKYRWAGVGVKLNVFSMPTRIAWGTLTIQYANLAWMSIKLLVAQFNKNRCGELHYEIN